MPLPPKGHPDRPLRLAARTMLVLGVLLLLMATCVGGVAGTAMFNARNSGRPTPGPGVFLLVALLAVYVLPGATMILCWHHLKEYRRWAVIVGLVVAGLALAVSLLGLVSNVIGLLVSDRGSVGGLIMAMLFLAAFGQLLYHLIKSFEAIRLHEQGQTQGHGFQPIYDADLFDEATSPSDSDRPK